MKKAKITAEGDFSQPSSKHHSFVAVFLVSLITNLMLRERQDFEINKPCQRKGEKLSQQNGQLIYHCIPETIKFDFRAILLRRIKYLSHDCLTENYHTDLLLLLKKCARNIVLNNIQPPSCLRCTVSRKERLSSQG